MKRASRRDRTPREPLASPPASRPLPRPLIMTTAFIAGMAVMVLELMGSRVIGPFYGVSLYVWASLIATALVALAVGYWAGGRLADRRESGEAMFGAVLLAAAFVCVIPLLRVPALRATASLGVRAGSLVSAVLLFFPPICCLGIVAPYAVKLHARSLATVGGSAGLLSALSTAGSVVGTLLTGFVLIPALPMDAIILGLGGVLAATSLAFWIGRPRAKGLAASAVVLLVVAVVLHARGPAPARLRASGVTVLRARETPYGQLKIMDAGGIRYLLLNGSFQGEARLDTGRPAAPYIHLLAAACREYAPAARRVLCVGLGAGTLPALVQAPGVVVDAVDIDPAVIDAAKTFFGYRPSGTVVAEDGRRYCAVTENRYDAILLDAFASEAIPEHLLSREAFRDYRRLLDRGGILGINVVGFSAGGLRRVPDAVLRTAAAIFPHTEVWFIPQQQGGQFGSLIIIASVSPLPPKELGASARATAGDEAWTRMVSRLDWTSSDGAVVTDRYNPLAAWNAPVDLAIRRQVLTYLPWAVLVG